jgi:phosphatidylserine decarboxylase
MKLLISAIFVICILYLYWRFFFFFRDPQRSVPEGEDSIVSPADGTLIYIKEILNDELFFSTKLNRNIRLQEFCANQDIKPPCYLVGIFMHPTSVHVNRAPIAGRIEKIDYMAGKNLPMTLTWWRVNLKMRPYEKYAGHLFSNERNIVSITGKIKLAVIQIADIYVNKIECWVKEKEQVSKGQRFGMIKMGSQVDVLLPKIPGLFINVAVGQKMKAGETVIAYFDSEEGKDEDSVR